MHSGNISHVHAPIIMFWGYIYIQVVCIVLFLCTGLLQDLTTVEYFCGVESVVKAFRSILNVNALQSWFEWLGRNSKTNHIRPFIYSTIFFYDVAGIATVQFGMIFCITTSVSTIHNKCQHHTGKVPKTIQGHLLSLVLHAIGKCANTIYSIKNNMFNNVQHTAACAEARSGYR